MLGICILTCVMLIDFKVLGLLVTGQRPGFAQECARVFMASFTKPGATSTDNTPIIGICSSTAPALASRF